MAQENVSFREAENIYINPSYAKIVTNNRFAVLNNSINFPPLPNSNQTSFQSTPVTLRKPVNKSNIPSPKKRKTSPISPTIESPPVKKSPQFKVKINSVRTNPYRDEYMSYKEKSVFILSTFIKELQKNFPATAVSFADSEIREFVNNMYDADNSTDKMDLSYNGSGSASGSESEY